MRRASIHVVGLLLLVGTGLPLAMGSSADAVERTVYAHDFSTAPGPEWESVCETCEHWGIAPSGERFLDASTIRLRLDGLEPHSIVTVSFDLYILAAWRGGTEAWDGSAHFYLPWNPEAAGYAMSFSNCAGYLQSYPDFSTPIGPSSATPSSAIRAPTTGAVATNTLGWPPCDTTLGVGDSTYRLTLAFAHADPEFIVEFEHLAHAPWGIDNVVVTTTTECLPLADVPFAVACFHPREYLASFTARFGDDLARVAGYVDRYAFDTPAGTARVPCITLTINETVDACAAAGGRWESRVATLTDGTWKRPSGIDPAGTGQLLHICHGTAAALVEEFGLDGAPMLGACGGNLEETLLRLVPDAPETQDV